MTLEKPKRLTGGSANHSDRFHGKPHVMANVDALKSPLAFLALIVR